jgi:hypothetical protein
MDRRRHIQDVLALSGYIREGVVSPRRELHFDDLRGQYPLEYFQLLATLKPEELEAAFARRAEELRLAEEGRLVARALVDEIQSAAA